VNLPPVGPDGPEPEGAGTRAEPGGSASAPGTPAPPRAPDDRAAIDAYVAANAGRFTDEAITEQLLQAGHRPELVKASVAASREGFRPARPRAVRAIIAAYGITYLVLSAGMLLHHGQADSSYMPTPAGGIGLLALTLGISFGLSMVWVASRRAFVVLAAVAVGISALGSIGSGGGISVGSLAILVVVGGAIVWLLRRPATNGVRTDTAMGVLLVLPILLLLVVGGICVASGLPIPSAG
jgi:hypothetical protein